VGGDGLRKSIQIHQGLLQVSEDAAVFHVPIQVDQTISEPRHRAEMLGERRIQHAMLAKNDETVGVVSRKPVVLGGNHVIRDVNTALDGNDEMVFGVADPVRTSKEFLRRQRRQLAQHAGVSLEIREHLIELDLVDHDQSPRAVMARNRISCICRKVSL